MNTDMELSTQEKTKILNLLVWGEFPEDRCPICGWPLKEDVSEGCVKGNCSLRPPPKRRADELLDFYKPENMWILAQVIEYASREGITYAKIDSENIHESMIEAADEIIWCMRDVDG